ncbi:hypothetical protein GGI35DRAFT_462410 [Trichoderma velutinum]
MDKEIAQTYSVRPNATLLPQRVLRKGTRSCVECKKRKIRCFFDPAAAAAECVGCRRRGTACVSQEFVDIATANSTAGRLERVEQLLETITSQISKHDCGGESRTSWKVMQDQTAEGLRDVGDSGQFPSTPENITAPSERSQGILVPSFSPQAQRRQSAEQPSGSGPPSPLPHPKYSDTCRALYAALPSQQDADTLFGAGRASMFLQALCNPQSEWLDQGSTRPSPTLSTLPPATSHPVILARTMLQLALCVQQLEPSFDRRTLHLGLDPAMAMRKYAHLASSMVTCHDEHLSSLEGLECLLYEAIFRINCGSLRLGLACLRRATTLALFMGVHRKGPKAPLTQHHPETHVSLEVIWTRIAYFERYVSLLLGMPTSITNPRFASEVKGPGETDSQWFEKRQIDICGHIIQRNQYGNYDIAPTEEIDRELNRMASRQPAKWWARMDLRPDMRDDELMAVVIDSQMQIIHFNMVTVLHLPFLLRPDPDDCRLSYSKTTCTYASREVLNRYIAFRSIFRVVFCCRPVDFCALTAILSLLLAHLIEPDQQRSGFLSSHQRLGDRALIERTVETLDELNQLNGDELSREITKLARRLLELDAASSQTGDTYRCTLAPAAGHGESAGESLHPYYQLDIPYFGSVRLVPQPSVLDVPARRETGEPNSNDGRTTNISGETTTQKSLASEPHLASQFAGGQQLDMSSELARQPLVLPRDISACDGQLPVVYYPGLPRSGEQEEAFDVQMPDFMADAGSWAFQGVDTAFFDSLMSGHVFDETCRDGDWITY